MRTLEQFRVVEDVKTDGAVELVFKFLESPFSHSKTCTLSLFGRVVVEATEFKGQLITVHQCVLK